MFKSRFLVYQKHEAPSEGLPKKEDIDRPFSIDQDEDKLAEQSEKSKRKALGRLYSNLNEKLQNANRQIINSGLDEKINADVYRASRQHNLDSDSNIGVAKQIIRDFMNNFIAQASPKEKELLKKHNPLLHLVLSKPSYVLFTVKFNNSKATVNCTEQPQESWQADTNKPAPLKEGSDKSVKKMHAEIKSKMKTAFKHYESIRSTTGDPSVMLNIINDYLGGLYNNYTATERAKLSGGSIEKNFDAGWGYIPWVRVRFAANNYTLSLGERK